MEKIIITSTNYRLPQFAAYPSKLLSLSLSLPCACLQDRVVQLKAQTALCSNSTYAM